MTDIVTETIVKASRERAWQAWTDPDELAAWWWPMFTDTTYDLDVPRAAATASRAVPPGSVRAGLTSRSSPPCA